MVTSMEMFRKTLDFIEEAGDKRRLPVMVSCHKYPARPGHVQARSIQTPLGFKGQVYSPVTRKKGSSYSFLNNYRPQFYFRTTDVTGVITRSWGTEMCMPGDNVDMDVELITPIAIERGPPLRYPRGRSYRRFRRGHRDQRVIKHEGPPHFAAGYSFSNRVWQGWEHLSF